MSHDADKEPSDWQVSMLKFAVPILIGIVAVSVLDFACQPRQPPLPTQEEMDRTIRRAEEFLDERKRAREAEKTKTEKILKTEQE